MKYDIDRFVHMHELYFSTALNEIKSRKKRSHWMWYIFPQLKGLGNSSTSHYYGISGIEEANEYWNNKYLKNNMLEILTELFKLNDNIDNIFGYPDNLKLKSCMTLFGCSIKYESIFQDILDKFYNGEKDEKTLTLLDVKII